MLKAEKTSLTVSCKAGFSRERRLILDGGSVRITRMHAQRAAHEAGAARYTCIKDTYHIHSGCGFQRGFCKGGGIDYNTC